MADTIGKAFEELDDSEMYAIQGGGPATVTSIASFSSAPCTIGMGVVSLVPVVGTVIYTVCKK